MFKANAIFALSTYPGLLGIVWHSEIGNAQYVLYAISVILVLAATFHQMRVLLAIFERYTIRPSR